MESSKSVRMLRSMLVTSNLLSALVALLSILAGLAIILDSSQFEKINQMQALKVRKLAETGRQDFEDRTGTKGTDRRSHKFELQLQVSRTLGERKMEAQESVRPAHKPTTRRWKNFPFVLVAVAGLTLLTSIVGLFAVHQEPLVLLLSLMSSLLVLLLLQSFALGVLVPLEDLTQSSLNEVLRKPIANVPLFYSFHKFVIPTLIFNCTLSSLLMILCFVQLSMHRRSTQSPFEYLQPI